MNKNIVLHDQRLSGRIQASASTTTLEFTANTSLKPALAIIAAMGRLDGIQGLYIACHGYAGVDTRGRLCVDAGGMGLQLGKEGLVHSNAAQWTAIRGAVSNIVVYACAAADTQRNNRGTTADGRYLMGALAIHTQATVYAADRIQWYTTKSGVIDFGKWEGTLWKFDPEGTCAPAPANRAPVELSQI